MQGNAIALAGRIHEAAGRWLADELAAAGLAGMVPSHGDVLACLFENGDTSMHELAAFAHRTRATTTVLVDKMEQMGLVRRTRSSGDARCQIVSLTPKGGALRPTFADISRRLVARAYAGLSPADGVALEGFLAKVLGNFTHNPERKKQ
jgi:DNA-binding MarR family transcriptional regulator